MILAPFSFRSRTTMRRRNGISVSDSAPDLLFEDRPVVLHDRKGIACHAWRIRRCIEFIGLGQPPWALPMDSTGKDV